MIFPALLVFLVLFSFSLESWAQTPIPPSTFPDVSSTPAPTTISSAGPSTSTLTTPVPSGSASAPVSGNATQTSSAQFPSLSGYSSCVSQCLATSISMVGCSSLVDVNCFCPSDRFPTTYTTCLASNCPTEVSSAESLVQQFCKVSNSTSTSLSFPSIPVTTSMLVTSRSTSGSSSASASPTSAANNSAVDTGVGFGLLVTVLSVVLGAYIVD